MKAMLFVIAVGSLALSALVTPDKADDQQCLYVYSVAEEIMYKRQHGTPLPEMLNPVQGGCWPNCSGQGSFLNVPCYEYQREQRSFH